jgi:membrane fusion protein (multidrug efflux system)
MTKTKMIAALFILTVAVVWGVMKFRTGASAAQDIAVAVQTAKVKQTVLPLEARAIGSLVARSVEITPEVAGHVDKILVQDGAPVKQGESLIQLDNAVANARFESAKAQLVYSESDYRRKALLGKQGVVAQQAIDQASADLKEKRASARENEVMLSKMMLTAPFEGVVGKSKVNPGDYVNVAQSVLTLTDTHHLRIEYNVPEKYLPLLKLGQQVKITTSTYPDKVFIGKVAFISPTINTENRSVSLYAEVPNDTNMLAPGMFVDVLQALGREDRVLMVPARSLVPVLDGEQVYKVVDGKAYPVTVLTGKRIEDSVQITQGLASGDVIITDGQLKVKNGTPVKSTQ